MINEIRQKAKELLETKTVDCVIGYERATDGVTARPLFVYEPSQVDKLIFDETCTHNLSKYLLNRKDKTTAIIVKPCDSRAINVLLNERQIAREKILILGVVCQGIKNVGWNKIDNALQGRCQFCSQHTPIIYDFLFGEPVTEKPCRDYSDIIAIEKMPIAERQAFWSEHFTRCIRCYGCRQVCPGCYCFECFVEQLDPLWVGIRIAPSENRIWNTIRAFHLSARCIACGECERVCPVNIPLMLINRKLEKDTLNFFHFETGLSSETVPPFATFKKEEDLESGR